MVIREGDDQLDISGPPAELNAVAAAIERLAPGDRVSIPAGYTADPRPYARCLASLDLHVSTGPVRVAVEGTRAVVTGRLPMLRTFASYFQFEEGPTPGTHGHHEWFEGNEYLARGSVPVVVGVR